LLAAEVPFLPPQSTVLLLCGLPGDLESETSYRQQLQGWLDLLAGLAVPPGQVFVFWDGAEPPAAPGKLPVSVSAASRESFLALGKKLAGQTNPLVAIVWGHGGLQGKTPVFHVRGPRITAADMKSFAAQMPRAESRWVLCFRGSGRFASDLIAEHREIISSEHGSIFNSDPMGLPLLLKAVQTNPSNSFVNVAEELGRAVSGWYDERHLARTEEPTLWLPDQEPRRLALSEKGGALSSVPEPEKGGAPVLEDPVKPAASSTNLPAVWKEIVRVDPRKYPEADAVVLRRRLDYTLGSSPAISSEQDQFIQILTAEGKHYGDFDVAYSPPQEELNILDCEVLLPEGRLIRVEKEEIREQAEAPLADYRTSRRKFFSMPGVGPGAVLRLHYRTEWKDYPVPHVMLTLPVSGPAPILETILQVTVPKESPFHFAFEQQAPAEPAVKQTTHGSAYTWSFKDTPARTSEPLAPPHGQPALLISTWPDWAEFAGWYERIIKLANELTPELAGKAKALTAQAGTDREKIIALYNYVTSLRYVMVPLGVNSFRPHAAAHVFKNQYGDCKDKANLFNTMLRSLGFEACLVLVPRFSQAHETLPGLAFNHAISRVAVGAQVLWVDTTDDVCRFGMLPPGDAGRRVLVIDGQSTNLTLLPLPAVADHRLEVRAELTWASSGEAAPISLRAKATGFPDYELRQLAGAAREHRQQMPLLAAAFRPSAGVFSLSKQSATPASRLEEDFALQAEGQCLGLVSVVDGRQLMRSPFWLPKEWELALPPRAMPLFLNQGYPLTLDEEIEITLPAGAKQVVLPPVQESTAQPLRWKVEWTKNGARSVRARLQLALARGELAAQEAPELQKQLRQLLTALANGASLVPAP
jgi:hypothetical protein